MFFYIVFTPIFTTYGLSSTGNSHKYQKIDVYIYQCGVLVSAMEMAQIEKFKYDDFIATCLQVMSFRSHSVTIFAIYDKNDCLYVHYSFLKQWQRIRIIKVLSKLNQKLKFQFCS